MSQAAHLVIFVLPEQKQGRKREQKRFSLTPLFIEMISFAFLLPFLPLYQCGAPGKPCAEAGKEKLVSFLQPSVPVHFI